jgi:2-oxoglutarate dehydrogenase complex dehydrogenase (E1) component-like enzyme
MTDPTVTPKALSQSAPAATATGDKALSYVPKIIAAYQKTISASNGSLAHAIEAGELLNSAKEALPKKGGWLRWLGHNLPDIPQTTASLYMRLAENKNVIDKQRVASAIEEGKLSIRAAAKLIPQSAKSMETAAKRKATVADNKAAAAANQIEDLLRDLAVDEVYTALKNTMSIEDLLQLARMILERNEKSDSPRTELDRRLPPPTVPMQRRV